MNKTPYEVLGVSPSASRDDIRRQYLARVREFPPETHPDEFEAVRYAYETLSSPTPVASQTAEPEMLLPFMDALDGEVGDLMAAGDWKQVLSKVKAESEPYRSLVQSLAYFHQNRWDSHIRARDRALKHLEKLPPESLTLALAQWQQLYLVEANPPRPEDALALYDRYRSNPSLWKLLWLEYGDILGALGRREEIFPLVEPILPHEEDSYSTEGTELLLTWLAYLEGQGKRDLAKRYQSRGVRYWRRANPQQITEFKEHAEDLLQVALDHQNLEVARALAELVSLVDREDQEAKTRLWNLNEHVALDREVARLQEDPRIYPPVAIDAAYLFEEAMGWGDDGMDLLASTLRSIKEREWYAESIGRLKKSYPTVYRVFRDDWDASLAELTVGMNREQRRRLTR